MTELERFKEYKKKMLEGFSKFMEAYDNLVEIFYDDEFECNDFITKNYPFERSFDDLCIGHWRDTVEEKLNAYEKKLKGDTK